LEPETRAARTGLRPLSIRGFKRREERKTTMPDPIIIFPPMLG
jgi:hypothetical protein